VTDDRQMEKRVGIHTFIITACTVATSCSISDAPCQREGQNFVALPNIYTWLVRTY